MIRRAHSLCLVAPVLAATLSGCGVWDAWRYRTGEPSRYTTYNPHSAVQPGHSTDAGAYGRDNSPASQDAAKSFRSMERLAPPPAPPVRGDALPSDHDQPVADQNGRLQPSPDNESRLIRTLKMPRMFTPDSVRSIYDRFRSPEDSHPPVEKPVGPIARKHSLESDTLTCQYAETSELTSSAVELGLPEVDGDADLSRPHPLSQNLAQSPAAYPSLMQASPSSFKHPLLADPTGVPYGIR